MRTYPENIEELEKKHDFSFPINPQKLETIQSNLILRHDIAFLFLKLRIVNSLQEKNIFKNEANLDSFLDKKFDTSDRLKIYNAIKNNIVLSFKKEEKSLFHYLLNSFSRKEKPDIDTRVTTIREFICSIIKQHRIDIKENFELIFKKDIKIYT
ncbi:hypothetical protein [Aureivirga sp. CE67]|uniref:hypothetical protein n=1 Tax=Aureivirga sp. CE67 TaxID=1788983 RepID=UPI0018CA04A5|nr:hypothetical protein [Aureivirga sp. CE67]